MSRFVQDGIMTNCGSMSRFLRFGGDFVTGENGQLLSISATARASSVDTDNIFRDMHLRRLYMVIDYEYYAQRMNRLKEELIQAYMHPKRVLKYLTKYQYDLGNDEYNYDF